MKVHYFLLISAFILITSPLFANIPPDSSKAGTGVYYKDIQFDVTTAVFVSNLGTSIDVDFLRSGNRYLAFSAGVKTGIDYYAVGSVSGSSSDSPYTDYNLLTRITEEGRWLRTDITGGITYHNPSNKSGKIVFRCGMDLKFMIFRNVVGLILRTAYNSNSILMGGIGLFYSIPEE